MASVKVAVRVRPINKRERDMDSKVIIKVEDKKTSITNPQLPSDVKDFSYDHSYWSADSRDKHFATQEQVFNDLGMEVIESAFQGYNACIFAYGQTGSGKSYTMMGCQGSIGLIPRICESMYSRMAEDQINNKVEFKTEVSYLEIYNERVRDLLRPLPKKGDAFNLKVREHPKEGPYVQDLTKHIVSKYIDIEKLMEVGNEHRTTASTNMNDTSSRSHAIFTLNFTQAKFHTDSPSETVSKIHLVDLAGSERANSTGATGQRLKEGANINKSLVTLGSVISALAELSSVGEHGSKKKHFIPYRDSVLTWLLKDSLGGNSKTIMIAAISPADVNYAETISTLRYANRAKNIINKPTINEDENVRLIRDLRDEIENLRQMLEKANKSGIQTTGQEAEEEKRMTEQLQKNEAQVQHLYKEWNNKWKETHKIMEEKALAFRREGFGIKMESDYPHLICIDDDILSTGVTLYHLTEGRTHVGRDDAVVKQDIVLHGPGIETEHCVLESIEGNVTLLPLAEECYVNGNPIKKLVRLSQGAVILLGKTNMFRFNHPGEAAKLRKKYASVGNLASMVPTTEIEEPSYLFYNAGMEMERRYRQEAQDLDTKRKEIEKIQEDDAKKIEDARRELNVLQEQRIVAEEEQRKELDQTQQHLHEQREQLLKLKEDQDRAKENAQKELQLLKARIQQEQEEEKRKLDEEMKRLMQMREMTKKAAEEKEALMAKQQEELERQLIAERMQIEAQRAEVVRLQDDYETSRKSVSAGSSPRQQDGVIEEDACSADGSESVDTGKVSLRAEQLRQQLDKLEAEYDDAKKTAQKEILAAKEKVKQAEVATLQGKVNLMEGKNLIQSRWKELEELQTRHKSTTEQIQSQIEAVRCELEVAEQMEEEELMEQEKSILERRKARKKVREATEKLLEMESRLPPNPLRGRTISTSSAGERNAEELAAWQQGEELREVEEQRTVLMELLNNHQVALVKASQLVTETKTKLDSHLHNEQSLVSPLKERIGECTNQLQPALKREQQLEKRWKGVEQELIEKKKVLYKQRKRINLLEKQHSQALSKLPTAESSDGRQDSTDSSDEAELELIHREKSVLQDIEEKYKREQDDYERNLTKEQKEIELEKAEMNAALEREVTKLNALQMVNDETTQFIEAELSGRQEILSRVKEKVKNDKRQLAALETKVRASASAHAHELFEMADTLEKELADDGKKEELSRIKTHRKKLQELDRQLRTAEKRERLAMDGEVGPDGAEKCLLL